MGVIMSSEKGTRLSQRHDPEILTELKEVSDETGVSQVSLVAACIKALYKTWREENRLVLPFRVVSESEWLEYKASR